MCIIQASSGYELCRNHSESRQLTASNWQLDNRQRRETCWLLVEDTMSYTKATICSLLEATIIWFPKNVRSKTGKWRAPVKRHEGHITHTAGVYPLFNRQSPLNRQDADVPFVPPPCSLYDPIRQCVCVVHEAIVCSIALRRKRKDVRLRFSVLGLEIDVLARVAKKNNQTSHLEHFEQWNHALWLAGRASRFGLRLLGALWLVESGSRPLPGGIKGAFLHVI